MSRRWLTDTVGDLLRKTCSTMYSMYTYYTSYDMACNVNSINYNKIIEISTQRIPQGQATDYAPFSENIEYHFHGITNGDFILNKY